MLSIPIPDWVERAGVQSEWFLHLPERIPALVYGKLWESLVHCSGQEALAIQLATHIQPSNLGLMGIAMCSSQRVASAIEKVRRYKKLLNDDTIIISETAQKVQIVYELANPGLPGSQYILEHACVGLHTLLQWLTKRSFSPLEVHATFSRPSYSAHLEDRLGDKLYFKRAYNALVYPKELLHYKIDRSLEQLEQQVAQQVEQALEDIKQENAWSQRVIQLLSSGSLGMTPQLGEVAQQCHVSPRTLQRKLKSEQTSFQSLLQKHRCHLAYSYLKQQQYSIEEIAFITGFSELSSFTRAFKSWTGFSPRAYRLSKLSQK